MAVIDPLRGWDRAWTMPWSGIGLTGSALLMFAANSLLCRHVLGGGLSDAASFTVVRLVSGAVMLLVITTVRDRTWSKLGADPLSAFWLFLYAAPFSFAYLGLSAATGALILFPVVQITMLTGAWRDGERPTKMQWAGLIAALAGLCYLVAPGLSAPPLMHALLMTLAGIAWGLYSLRGKRAGDPLRRNTASFAWASVMALVLLAPMLPSLQITSTGALLAAASGAFTSAIGYVLWYAALQQLTTTHAAILQLTVPVFAAIGGSLLLNESVTWRLGSASLLVIGGVALAQLGRRSVLIRT